VQRAEHGQRRIALGEAAAIAESLGRSLDELVKASEAAVIEPPKMGRPRRAADRGLVKEHPDRQEND
jgi:hypothetical protein